MNKSNGPVNILIIETDNLFRLSLSQHLRLKAYRIFEAINQSGVDCTLKKENIDVAILDLRGLHREGLTILKSIKTISPSTEVILLNSSKQLALSIEGMKLGAFDDFLIPFDIDSLIVRIRQAYQSSKNRQRPINH